MVVWTSRLIIHVLLMSLMSCFLSRVCLFCSFFGSDGTVLIVHQNPCSKVGFSTKMFQFDPEPCYSRVGCGAREGASNFSDSSAYLKSFSSSPGLKTVVFSVGMRLRGFIQSRVAGIYKLNLDRCRNQLVCWISLPAGASRERSSNLCRDLQL